MTEQTTEPQPKAIRLNFILGAPMCPLETVPLPLEGYGLTLIQAAVDAARKIPASYVKNMADNFGIKSVEIREMDWCRIGDQIYYSEPGEPRPAEAGERQIVGSSIAAIPDVAAIMRVGDRAKRIAKISKERQKHEAVEAYLSLPWYRRLFTKKPKA